MPARLAIQASRVHNAWLCLIWIVLFFRPGAKKTMRTETPPQRSAPLPPFPLRSGWRAQKAQPPPTATPQLLLPVPSPAVFRSVAAGACVPCGLRLAACPATVYILRAAFANSENSRRSASPSASFGGAERPAER